MAMLIRSATIYYVLMRRKQKVETSLDDCKVSNDSHFAKFTNEEQSAAVFRK